MFLASNTSKYLYALISITAVSMITVLFLILPSATIKIKPYQEAIMADYSARLSAKIETAAANLDLLPVKKINIDLRDKQKIQNKYQLNNFLFFNEKQEAVFLLSKIDLKNFINNKVNISLQADKNRNFTDKELILNLDKNLTFWPENFKSDSLDLKINLESRLIQKFDLPDLKKSVKGKKNDLALEILKEKIGPAGEFELKFFPNFMPRVSWLEKRIKIIVDI